MNELVFDYSNTFVKDHEITYLKEQVGYIHDMLHRKEGPGSEFIGWIDYPCNYDMQELEEIVQAAEKIKQNAEVLIVIGIGGSYLGTRAAIEMLKHSFYNLLSKDKRKTPQIFFLGNHLSGTYYKHLMDIVRDKELCICVISKSGTTTEPAIAFRLLRTYMEDRYGQQEARNRIYVITDKKKGALRKLADEKNYTSFVIPDDVGGRYSVLTPVGLLPIATVGINITDILKGAKDAYEEYNERDLEKNVCYQYATLRNILYKKGKVIEVLVSYEPSLQMFTEWWKQLFGESEGKDKKGIFPASVQFTTDLHSIGQFLQDGTRNIFETIINVKEPEEEVIIPRDPNNVDGLNFIHGKSMDFVNKKALEGTALAHADGDVPNLVLTIPKISPYYFGKLVYFFEKACAVSGYLLGVNPFDQPGVEAYKKNMYALLGKEGYEVLGETLRKRLGT